MSEKKSVEQIQQENFSHFMEGGPRLSSGYQIFVVAKDSKKGRVLLGGLGAMGVGQMWMTMDHTRDSQRPGWDEAPEIDSPDEYQPPGTLPGPDKPED